MNEVLGTHVKVTSVLADTLVEGHACVVVVEHVRIIADLGYALIITHDLPMVILFASHLQVLLSDYL